MSVQSYITLDNVGRQVRRTALTSSTGPGSAGEIVALDVDGKIHLSMLPQIVSGQNVVTVPAGELLAAGNFVSLISDSGTLKAYNSIATSPVKPAIGFVLLNTNPGDMVDVYVSAAANDKLSGLVPGKAYYLSPLAAGGVTDSVPVDPAHFIQYLGTAVSATTLRVNVDQPEQVMAHKVVTMTAAEAITTGQFLYVGADGQAHVSTAVNQTGATVGFALDNVLVGEPVRVFLGDGENPYLSSLTPGKAYYLGVDGQVVDAPSMTAGMLLQYLGVAISTTSLRVDIDQPVCL